MQQGGGHRVVSKLAKERVTSTASGLVVSARAWSVVEVANPIT